MQIKNTMDYKALGKAILFKGMTEEELQLCLAGLRAYDREYAKGATILYAGHPTDRMGLVLSGSVTIESNDVWGNCTILSHIGPGQIFAETYALLPEEVMLVDVRANENCRILFLNMCGLPGGSMNRLTGGHTGGLSGSSFSASWMNKLIRNLLLISAHKNLTLSGRSFHTAPKSARGRILSYLNTVSLQLHTAEFDIPFDRQQLADYLNLERTNMSKELTRMKQDGIIECRKNHFKLLKTDVHESAEEEPAFEWNPSSYIFA